jgi:hypothetical protein
LPLIAGDGAQFSHTRFATGISTTREVLSSQRLGVLRPFR